MNLKSAKILTILMVSGILFFGCGGDGDRAAPLFSSATTANDLLDGNFTSSTVVYDATANNDANIAYTLASGVGSNDLFTIASNGYVTFKTLPSVSGAHNDYNLTITATDSAHNSVEHNVTLRVMNDVIDLGTTRGFLIAPVYVNGKWFYYWDMSGDGTNDGDSTSHDLLDTLFNHDINGTVNTTVANVNGVYGTTNDYRYATINGVKLALPTTGSGNVSEMSSFNLKDNQAYTDLAEIWDSFNMGNEGSSGTPIGWKNDSYWSATLSRGGHASVGLFFGSINDFYLPEDCGGNDGMLCVPHNMMLYVALQVL